MKKAEALNIYRVLAGAKFDKVEKKEERYALLDMVLALDSIANEWDATKSKAFESLKDDKDREEYLTKILAEDIDIELSKVSKATIYELIDSNKETMKLGAISMIKLLTQ